MILDKYHQCWDTDSFMRPVLMVPASPPSAANLQLPYTHLTPKNDYKRLTNLRHLKTARGRFETKGITLYHRENRFILSSSKFNADTR